MKLPSSDEYTHTLDINEKQSEISSYVGKVLRDNFGKGPGSVYVSIADPFVVIYVKDFLSPMERVLYSGNQQKTVEKTRSFLMDTISAEIRAYIKLITKLEIESLYYDWSLENQSGVFLGVGSDPIDGDAAYSGKSEVHDAVVRMSKKVEKEPAAIRSTRINSRTLIVVRDGILVEIEKQLIRDGQEEALRNAKGKLEKGMLNLDQINSHIEGEISEVFIDWDFDIDRSFLVMILTPDS
ncbi:DUF2294 domain-containing protein [Bacillus sp. Marseille-Q3570]|uniref:DUF2294 domain-containing protein n=1 Tax=Bacillus sp. Marseille-Q3570 TaxID=2963522 RepID=UPI0021B7BEE7|nr:DUF2294 domain-containing protein [Bacillus sp. Marseille-Q3570]